MGIFDFLKKKKDKEITKENETINNLSKNEDGSRQYSTNRTIFTGDETITFVTLPSNLQTIQESMFEGCINLKEIVIPKNVISIEKNAFKGCTSLQKVTFEQSHKHLDIGQSAFEDCINLKEVNFRKTTQAIEKNAFKNCSSLVLQNLEETDVCIIEKNAFANAKLNSTFRLPNSIEEISDNAFSHTAIEKILFDRKYCKLQKIGEGAFAGTLLNKLTLPNGIVEIPANAFAKCELLKEVDISENVRLIGTRAFFACPKLSKVNFEASDKKLLISEEAFEGCFSLENVFFGTNVSAYENSFSDSTHVNPSTVEDFVLNNTNFSLDKLLEVENKSFTQFQEDRKTNFYKNER